MPVWPKFLCIDCGERDGRAYGRCPRCYVRFTRKNPDAARWRSMSRAQRQEVIRAARAAAEWKQSPVLPKLAKPWEWEGDEAALGKQCGQNDESEIQKQTSGAR